MKHFWLILLFASNALGASIYFVSPAGDDFTGNGSIGNPWRTITKGVNSMAGGDTLNIRAGTYVPGSGAESSPIPNPPSGGGESTRTVITAYNSEVIAIMPNTGDFGWNNSSGAYVDWVDLDINLTNAVGSSGACLKITENAHHNRVIRTKTQYCWTGHGILISGGTADNANNNVISNSVAYKNGWQWDGRTEDHGYYISTSGNVVDGCDISFSHGVGIHHFSSGSNNTIRNTVSHNNIGDGIVIQSVSDTVIYNTITYSNGIGFNIGSSAQRTSLFNNTAYKNRANAVIQPNITGWVTMINNLFDHGNDSVDPGGLTINASGQIVTNWNTLSCDNNNSNYRNDNGSNTKEANNLIGNQYDALFSDAANTNFAITASSSARNTGSTVSSVPVDILGVTRPQESVYDIGAYEYNAGGTTPTVQINATTPIALENPVTPGVFTISRDLTNSAVTVNYQIAGTAVNGTDYNTITTNVTLAAGAFTGTVTITPVNDASIEGNETVILNLWPNVAYTLSTPTNATVTIVDDDNPQAMRWRRAPGQGKHTR